MNCKRFDSLIDDYLLGSVGGAARDDFERHLAGCPRCQRNFESARVLHEALRSADEPVPGPRWAMTEQRVLSRLRAQHLAQRSGFLGRLQRALSLRPAFDKLWAVAAGGTVIASIVAAAVWLNWLGTPGADLTSKHQPAAQQGTSQPATQSINNVASLLQGVEEILKENGAQPTQSVSPDTVLEAIASTMSLGALEPEAIETQVGWLDIWGLHETYQAEDIKVTEQEVKAAIQAISSKPKNGT